MSLKSVRTDWIPHRTPTFECSLEDRGSDVAAVRVAGELRAATAPELVRTLRRAERQAQLVVLDLRLLTLIDPCGVHVIAAAGIRAQRGNHRLVVVRGSGSNDAQVRLGAALTVIDVVDLEAEEPTVQALLELAQRDRAA